MSNPTTDTETDYYLLLNLDASSPIDPAALRKAYRRTSLLYHPDKNPSPDAAHKFHLLTLAFDVLSDPKTKEAYDNARAAKLARKRRLEVEGEGRRKMREDLEAREKGWKKMKMEEREAERLFQERLDKLKEEGVRLRMKREEALRKAEEEEQERAKQEPKADEEKMPDGKSGEEKSVFTELDRTVKVRWKRKPDVSITQEFLERLFSKFGSIQDCVLLPDRPDKDGKPRKLKTALLVYENIQSAYSAIHDSAPKEGFKEIKDVTWAGGKEPDVSSLGIGIRPEKGGNCGKGELRAEYEPGTKDRDLPTIFNTSSSTASSRTKKPPTFSFSPAPNFSFGTKSNESGGKPSLSSSDYESITLIRMREAEKKRLEEETRRKEAEEEDMEK